MDVIKNGISLDNTFVVPYNRSLLLHFQAHINVEYCGWNMLIKYLFKYISKGTDRVHYSVSSSSSSSVGIGDSNAVVVDEVRNFTDARFICPHEASWRIFNFDIHVRSPAVQSLAVHLPDMQTVRFNENESLNNLLRNPLSKRTTLTEWLYNNRLCHEGHDLRYIDYLAKYKWDPSGKSWERRQSSRTPPIGRLIYVHPSCGETFYLRMLLSHQKGCRTFQEIRTICGEVFPTYRAACERLGLLGDDNEWSHTIEEASLWATSGELRSLFTHILLHCDVTNPKILLDNHWRKMTDDSTRRHGPLSEDDQMQFVLYELQLLLCSGASPSSLSEFGLPMPRPATLELLTNRLLMDKKNYNKESLAAQHDAAVVLFNVNQRSIYDRVMSTLHAEGQVLDFVYGHGGTGKTFLWKTIISGLRSQGKIVLAVAASGVASLLLPSGRTAHSRFNLPKELTDQSTCNIKKNTQLGRLLTETLLIIWDEAPMSDRRCFESLDRSLRDLMNVSNKPFGGKSVLLGGDFRQTLPVIPRASKSTILASSLPRSYLWRNFNILSLSENMRLQQPGLNEQERAEIATYSSWLLAIGDGQIGIVDPTEPTDTKILEIPAQYLLPHTENALTELVKFIYTSETLENPTAVFVQTGDSMPEK